MRQHGDASGFNGRLTANLNPRAKLRVNAAAWREFAALESNLVAYSLNSGLSTGLSWDASGKLRFDATAQSERRRYQGLLAANFPGKLSDRLRQASATATWTVRPAIVLSASLSQQRRSGAPLLGNGSFKSNTVALNASAQF